MDENSRRKFPEPRWYGYSVGKWVDDTTFVVQTIGTMGDERVWLDEAGRPVSDAMRGSRNSSTGWTMTTWNDGDARDPKMYTKPWVAMNKFPMQWQSPDYDVRNDLLADRRWSNIIRNMATPRAA